MIGRDGKLERGLRLLAFAGENPLHKRTIFGILLILFFCSLSIVLQADDWPAPQMREVFSQNRRYFVRVTPGESLGESVGFTGAKIGKHAQAAFYREQPDKGYRFEREIELLNPVASVDFFVSNVGDLVTLDNWHNRGYGTVLALYHSDGKLVKSYKLADLFSKKELDSFSRSESSIAWHDGPTYIMEDRKSFYIGLGIHESDYQELILNLRDGSVPLCANPPMTGRRAPHCWTPGQPHN
jgi:hypothetical protein